MKIFHQVIKTNYTRIVQSFDTIIYSCRWLLAPMYLGLMVALAVYVYRFGVQLVELCSHIFTITESELLIAVLGLVDISMIGNLIIMITVGGYSIFVHRFRARSKEERPQWLDHINSGKLKVKMTMSLIGVSSIHLLKDFIGDSYLNPSIITKHVVIHLVFILSAFALANVDKILHPASETSEQTNHDTEEVHN